MSPEAQGALRILCGVWFLPHAFLKVKNANKAQATFAQVGLRPGKLFLYATVGAEIVAATCLISGWQPRLGALLGVGVLLGAGYAVVRIDGPAWRWNKQGIEYVLFWAIACALSVA